MHASHAPGKPTLLLLALAAASALLPANAPAQAHQTSGRIAGIDLFGAVSDTDTAFFGTDRHYGATAGIDYSQFRFLPTRHGLLTPSLELRGTYAPGNTVSESTIQGGAKVALNFHRLHPYVDALVGGGSISFSPAYTPPGQTSPIYAYTSDSSFLINYGGGLTYDILSRWALIADYEHQSWNLGFTPEIKFTPQSVSLGVVYHLRLKAFR